jgi:hypothetical protein
MNHWKDDSMVMGKQMRISIVFGILVGFAMAAHSAELKQPDLDVATLPTSMAHVKKEHPRLLISSQDVAEVKKRMQDNALIKNWYKRKKDDALRMLFDSPPRYDTKTSQTSQLEVSRTILDRVYTLAFLYHLEGDKKYLERLWQDVEVAAGFPDWHPDNFLDTATMTHAFAIAYDWLFNDWTPEQRKVLRTALVNKGLQPALAAYTGKTKYGWWVKSSSNWNIVCNSGIALGALALIDEEPEATRECLLKALQSVPSAASQFAPDGCYSEGPMYWGYATSYLTLLLASLHTSFGTDFGLSAIPGIAECGFTPIYLTGPANITFNFGDAQDLFYRTPQMFWLSQHFDFPAFASYEVETRFPHVLDILWMKKPAAELASLGIPLDRYFRGAEVVTMRSSWGDKNAVFVGFKAGKNTAPHAHLDIGTFVLDSQSKRWAVDLGPDDYELPGYFDEGRWNYYRLRAEGHNTIVLAPGDNLDQDPLATASIIRFQSATDRVFAIADLTPAYPSKAKRVWRGIALLDRKNVLIQDEISSDSPLEILWSMHTPAEVALSSDKRSAVLLQGSKRLRALILTPEDAIFASADAQPLPTSPRPLGQAENSGITKLTVHLDHEKDVRLTILLEPLEQGLSPSAPSLVPNSLAEW